MMNLFPTILSCILMLTTTSTSHSYRLTVASNLAKLPPSQIDHLCSYISQLPSPKQTTDLETIQSESPEKRFAVPFPDMTRFLSTSHKLHHHHEPNIKSEANTDNKKKHDFHAYLCSITEDSEEMSNFLSIFIEEHGQLPAFNIFESCEEVAKRDLSNSRKDETSSAIRLNELTTFCSTRPETRVDKRWNHSVEGPISIDFIHQMLESRKVKSYPYPVEMDPYIVGR